MAAEAIGVTTPAVSAAAYVHEDAKGKDVNEIADLCVATTLVLTTGMIYTMIMGTPEKRRLVQQIQVVQVMDNEGGPRGKIVAKTAMLKGPRMAADGTLVVVHFGRQIRACMTADGMLKPVSFFLRLIDMEGKLLSTVTQYVTEGDYNIVNEPPTTEEAVKGNKENAPPPPPPAKRHELRHFHGSHPKGVVIAILASVFRSHPCAQPRVCCRVKIDFVLTTDVCCW
jgi:hypothetical protein